MYNSIEVRSRAAIMEEAPNRTKPFVVISIITPGDSKPDFSNAPMLIATLPLTFADVDSGNDAITLAQAQDIARFVKTYDGQAEDLLVHCDAGISRSAGVAAALQKALWGDDSAIFYDHRFCPNMACYRVVLEAMGFAWDKERAIQQERINFLLWRHTQREGGVLD